jgi:hypothetical protein
MQHLYMSVATRNTTSPVKQARLSSDKTLGQYPQRFIFFITNNAPNKLERLSLERLISVVQCNTIA